MNIKLKAAGLTAVIVTAISAAIALIVLAPMVFAWILLIIIINAMIYHVYTGALEHLESKERRKCFNRD